LQPDILLQMKAFLLLPQRARFKRGFNCDVFFDKN